jgi:Cof subfamily protein (haloacid dehalogenase superfamily)
MTDVRLVAIDLDGTLLDDHKQASLRNILALESLLSHGVAVALASARDRASIQLKVPLALPGLYFIASGGALVFDTAADMIIWSHYLQPELVAESIRQLKRYNYPVFLNAEDDYWVDRPLTGIFDYDARVRMIEERYNLTTQPFDDAAAIHRPIMRVSLAAPAAVLEQAAAEASAALGDRLTVSLASPDWLDLLALEAGKGPALEMLQARCGIGPDQTLAIGDYDCDLALFEHARYRVAMGNAVASVKAAATYVTTSNNDDGVARALETIL